MFNWQKDIVSLSNGSVDGQITVYPEKWDDWEQFFGTLSEFNRWPEGRFWFSVRWVFDVPNRATYEKIHDRYIKHKGALATATYWWPIERASEVLSLIPIKISDALTDKGYKIESVRIRIYWDPEGYQPKWQ